MWREIDLYFLEELKRAGKLPPDVCIIDSFVVRAFGRGEAIRPSPLRRRKKGTKHTVLVNSECAPIVGRTPAANVSDQCQMMSTVTVMPRVRGSRGRPIQRPDVLYADRGYGSDETGALLRWLGIWPMIAHRGQDHDSGL